MLSSTSSSDARLITTSAAVHERRTYGIWLRNSAICLAVLCLFLEALTRLGFTRVSHIESRIAVEHRAALAIRRTQGTEGILLVGNSLPLEGIALPQLQRALAGHAHVTRFVIEATEYLDWYYGLRRLFAEHSNPDLVLLCLDATHLQSSKIRGDYSAFYLFQTADLLNVAYDANLDLTKTAGLFLGRYSLFYAGRTGIRNFALNHTDQRYAELVRNLPPLSAKVQQPTNTEALEARRLFDLQTLCRAHNAHLVLLTPPGFGSGEASLRQAAQSSGTNVFIPVHENEFPRTRFRDGYHLNESGAAIFTERLGTSLKAHLRQIEQGRK